MKPLPSFDDARPVAQHCAELTQRGPRPEERAELMTSWRRDLVRALGLELAPLFSGERLSVTISEAEMIPGDEVFARIPAESLNCLLRAGRSATTLLLSLPVATALALTDRSFGGDGAIGDEPVGDLPRSAALLVDRLGASFAKAIGLAGDDGHQGDVIARSESATRLKPFSPAVSCVFHEVTIASQDGTQSWTLVLALRETALDTLLPGSEATRRGKTAAPAPSDGTTGAFAAIPMPVDAILAEFEMSLARLEALAPGDEIPLAVLREIPLRIGEHAFAHGSLGTLDDRMAVRLDRILQGGN